MTWKDKFAIFCVKGERLIVKNKKKRIIGLIILVLIILTAGIFIFGHNHINRKKKKKKSLEAKSDINTNTKKEKVETIEEQEQREFEEQVRKEREIGVKDEDMVRIENLPMVPRWLRYPYAGRRKPEIDLRPGFGHTQRRCADPGIGRQPYKRKQGLPWYSKRSFGIV